MATAPDGLMEFSSEDGSWGRRERERERERSIDALVLGRSDVTTEGGGFGSAYTRIANEWEGVQSEKACSFPAAKVYIHENSPSSTAKPTANSERNPPSTHNWSYTALLRSKSQSRQNRSRFFRNPLFESYFEPHVEISFAPPLELST